MVATAVVIKSCGDNVDGAESLHDSKQDLKKYQDNKLKRIECLQNPSCSESRARGYSIASDNALNSGLQSLNDGADNIIINTPGTSLTGAVPTNIGSAIGPAASQ